MIRISGFILLLVLAGCAGTPRFDDSHVNQDVTPQQAVANTGALLGTQVLWGGIIIASDNLANATQFEVLAYPLSSDQKPDTEQPPLGRFLALQAGYVETTDYAPGRLITIQGVLDKTHQGMIGESEYTYPVIKVNQQHLWKISSDSDTRFNFGLGVMFHN